MYTRSGSISNRQTRMQGIGNQPPTPEISLKDIKSFLLAMIGDEQEAINGYAGMLRKLQTSCACAYSNEIEVIAHIKVEEQRHKALLEKLLDRMR